MAVLAATGGILLLGEPLTPRFFFASIAVLGGIALVVTSPFLRDEMFNVRHDPIPPYEMTCALPRARSLRLLPGFWVHRRDPF